jgi:uncharacterized repeat protein (TIGR03803 family)
MKRLEPPRTRSSGTNLRASAFALTLAIAFALAVAAAPAAQGQVFTVLYNFTGNGSNGAPYFPYAGLAITTGGNLYGTTMRGGTYEDGTAFRLKRAGSGWLLNVLYSFQGGSDGANPVAGVTIGPGGVLYGTTEAGGDQACGVGGGCGTVYSLRPLAQAVANAESPWIETVLYRFQGGTDGAVPKYGSLVFDSASNFYGTTFYGGVPGCGGAGCGTVYELSPTGNSWTESVLYSFNPKTDGSQPFGGIIRDQYNDLYGVTSVGYETFFTLQPGGNNDWYYYNVQQFTSSVGCSVDTSLLLDPNTFNFYGVAQGCGPSGSGAGGTVFNWFYGFNPAVYNFGFTRTPVSVPEGPLIEDAAGSNFYGVSFNGGAYQQGSVYQLSDVRGRWVYTELYDFTGGSDGAGPVGNLVMDANGNLYGVTTGGGSESGGVIFEITPN